jgi:glycine oxidase
VVVGAGVIGLALADELLRAGREVLLLERDRPGSGATWAAGGMLAPISEAEQNEPKLIEFGQDSLARYPEFIERLERFTGLSCGYASDGTLWIAVNHDDRSELDYLRETLRRKNLDCRLLSGEEVARREPHLSGRVLGGLLVEQDHQVDPRALSLCLEQSIRSRGGKIVCGAVVMEIAAKGGKLRSVRGCTARGERFDIVAEQLVLAAGAWTERELCKPLPELGVRPVKGQLVRLRGPRLLRHVVRTPDVYLVPRQDGELLIGATMEEMGYDSTSTAGAAMDLLRHAWEALPGIYDLELSEISVGLRSAADDHLPLIGLTEVEGLFVAVGHFRNGVLLAPATAHYLAKWMIAGQAPEELDAFRPQRLHVESPEEL